MSGSSNVTARWRAVSGKFMIIAAVLAVLVGGCSNVEPLTLDIDGVTYVIPRRHVVTTIMPGQGSLYVLAHDPGAVFQLIYSERHKISRNYQQGAPLVPHINNFPSEGFEQFDYPSGKTVCRLEVPHWNCGLRIDDGPVPWSVIFDRDQVPNSEAIRNAAVAQLAAYREHQR